jgi:GNAT superfamily N-acetyltransferase
MEKGNVFIRKAVREDAELVLDFIKGIARYEKMENEVEAKVEMIEEQLFDKGRAEVIFAVENGREVGFALFFHNFSTFVGRSGLYLEDLFVLPEYRGRGYGKALFLELLRIARERNCGRMEWVCLDWNKPSIDFYRSMGAVQLDEWTTYRLAGDALARLAE